MNFQTNNNIIKKKYFKQKLISFELAIAKIAKKYFFR